MQRLLLIFLAFAVASYGQTILDAAANDPRFSELATAVTSGCCGGLVTLLGDPNAQLTLFAPINSAFQSATITMPVLNVLSYHGVGQTLMASNLDPGLNLVDSALILPSLGGNAQKLMVMVENGNIVRVNNVPIMETIPVDNGIIYVIGTVLLPPENLPAVATQGGLTILVAAVNAANLAETLATTPAITVFSPPDMAFQRYDPSVLAFLTSPAGLPILGDILRLHVVAGLFYSFNLPSAPTTLEGSSLAIDGATINGYSHIVATDVLGENGVAHVIDTMLVPDSFTLIELLAALGLTSLADAIEAASLTNALSSTEARLTLFAPTNAAFEAAGPVAPEALRGILTYHVLNGMVLSTDLNPMQTVPTLNGAMMSIAVEDGVVSINNGAARVTIPDQRSFNAIIHVIDSVLLPPTSPTAPPLPQIDIACFNFGGGNCDCVRNPCDCTQGSCTCARAPGFRSCVTVRADRRIFVGGLLCCE